MADKYESKDYERSRGSEEYSNGEYERIRKWNVRELIELVKEHHESIRRAKWGDA